MNLDTVSERFSGEEHESARRWWYSPCSLLQPGRSVVTMATA